MEGPKYFLLHEIPISSSEVLCPHSLETLANVRDPEGKDEGTDDTIDIEQQVEDENQIDKVWAGDNVVIKQGLGNQN